MEDTFILDKFSKWKMWQFLSNCQAVYLQTHTFIYVCILLIQNYLYIHKIVDFSGKMKYQFIYLF